MKTIKVGLAGFGAAARYMHAPFLKVSPNYNVTHVLERHNNESAEFFPSAKIVRSFDDLVSADIDLTVITTPNYTHFPYTQQALKQGKNVLLEKPFTNTSAEALALIELAKKENLLLSVFQNRRYVSDFITVKEILEKNLLGDVHEFESHYDRFRPGLKVNAWREDVGEGTGVFFDLGPHLIDQMLCLFGLPKSITADIRTQRQNAKVDDYFDIRLDYGFNKVILKGGMMVREPGPRYMIHGTKGSFIKYGEDPQEVLLKQGILPNTADWGSENESIYGLLHTENKGEIVKMKYPSKQGNYGLLYQNLYNTIANKQPLKEKPEHGYNTVRLIELAFESNKLKATIPCTGLLDVEYPE